MICSFCGKSQTFYTVYNYFDGKERHTCVECSQQLWAFEFNEKVIKFHENDFEIMKKIFSFE